MDLLTKNKVNSTPLTPLTFLDRAAIVYGDSTSILYGDSISYTWSQTHRRCLQLASSLSSLGIKKGHVVSVLSPSTPAMYELQFAVPMSGAILNNLNFRLDDKSLSVILIHSESKLVFVDILSLSLACNALDLFPENMQRPELVLIEDDTLAPHQIHALPNNTYEGLIAKGDPNFKWIRPDSEWDPITLTYTSGTTSAPKGVVHCHRAAFIVSLDSLVDWSVPNQPVYLWTLQMFHSNGWSYPWGMAVVGGTNVCTRKLDAPTIYRLIETHGVTHMCAAPVVLNILLNFNKAEPLKNTVNVLTGGSSPPAAILTRAEELGFNISHGFGMTELIGVIISCAWKRGWDRLSAVEKARLKARQGVRKAGVAEVDVVGGNGESVKRDGVTVGEIVVKGACVMLGYLKDEKATAQCLKDGWFYTGDVAVMHEDGYLEIKDRIKDVIISGGENLSSVEVEAVLYMHPAVKEAAVVARPDEFWGETPCAFVSLKDELKETPTEKEIKEFCGEKLPRFMIPKTIVFKDELPKTSTGKIQKHVLRKVAGEMGSLSLSLPPPQLLPSRI
ncbi:2-methylpropanoate--CoA ligase CCL4-like [Vicia villosa]|uniref:2-methylpropanoate--CoA ligase CCL4-like n=1 Tax=Vicia villosa TaxID=3911 RepID=UPI00273B8263|nr:2-methylpropanoate--CoA ligase CCL4-like [Vicia villosa]